MLWRLLAQGSRYRPYDADALRFYRDKAGHPVSAAQAQKALEALRQRMPALVWKSARASTRWRMPPCTAGSRPASPPTAGRRRCHKGCCLWMMIERHGGSGRQRLNTDVRGAGRQAAAQSAAGTGAGRAVFGADGGNCGLKCHVVWRHRLGPSHYIPHTG